MLKTPEVVNVSASIWRSAVVASLQAGKSQTDAVDDADNMLLAYEARFCAEDEAKIGGTLLLRTAVKYFERHALVGKPVTVVGFVDVPPIGKIKDFADGSKSTGDMVLVAWNSATEETWTSVDKLQLIMPFNV
jgi:hypothetical protein